MYEATDDLRRQAHTLAEVYRTKGNIIWRLHGSIADSLDELMDGNPEPLDGVPFTVYDNVVGDVDYDQDTVAAFKAEWAREIGWMGGVIASLSHDLIASLD